MNSNFGKYFSFLLLFVLFSASFVDLMDSFSANGNELMFGIEPEDVVVYEFSGNWPDISTYENITFVFTEVSSSIVSATAHLFLDNGSLWENVISWDPNSSIFYYQWWMGFQIFIPLDLTVGDKTGSVVEYSEQYTSFNLHINGTVWREWFDCTRNIMYVQRRWSFQDWIHTVIAEYDRTSGIAYGLYESIQTEDELFTIELTMIATTCDLSALPLSISDVRHSPQKPTPDEQVSVTVEIDHPCYGVKAIHLLYSTDDGSSWTSKYIERSIIYTTTIPEHPEGTKVKFKIQAEDNAGNVVETDVMSYVVQAEQPPGIPGFPFEAILIGVTMATALLLFSRKKQLIT